VKFLVDAQLPAVLCKTIQSAGLQCIHVHDILDGYVTPDKSIIAYAEANNCVIVTKDKDFPTTFNLLGKPKQLVKVSVGNCSNFELAATLQRAMPAIVEALQKPQVMIEVFRQTIVIHVK